VAYRIVWSPHAIKCVHAIGFEIVRRDSVINAEKVVARIERKVAGLAQFPRAGRHVPEFPDEPFLEVICLKRRIIYEIHGQTVHILAVIDGRRILDRLDGE